MKEFFIYYSRSNDPLVTVQRIHGRAAAHARKIPKTVSVIDVDLDSATGDVLNCHSQAGTIECVTAEDANCKERARNPSLSQINGMIDRV